MAAEAVRELAEDLADELEALGRLPEAAALCQHHLGDPERAVGLLSQVRPLGLWAGGVLHMLGAGTWKADHVCRQQQHMPAWQSAWLGLL